MPRPVFVIAAGLLTTLLLAHHGPARAQGAADSELDEIMGLMGLVDPPEQTAQAEPQPSPEQFQRLDPRPRFFNDGMNDDQTGGPFLGGVPDNMPMAQIVPQPPQPQGQGQINPIVGRLTRVKNSLGLDSRQSALFDAFQQAAAAESAGGPPRIEPGRDYAAILAAREAQMQDRLQKLQATRQAYETLAASLTEGQKATLAQALRPNPMMNANGQGQRQPGQPSDFQGQPGQYGQPPQPRQPRAAKNPGQDFQGPPQ